MRHSAFRIVLLLSILDALIQFSAPNFLHAGAGDLDTTFGASGKVLTDLGSYFDEVRAVAIQNDGKIVAVGFTGTTTDSEFALARYNIDGTLDNTFGAGGKVTTDFGPIFDQAYAVAIQSDGKIVAAGYAYMGSTTDFALARYNPDGTLDTSFGSAGKVTTDFIGYDGASAVAIQTDGKIVAAGDTSTRTGNHYYFVLARYNPDGTLDNTFGGDGKVITAGGYRSASAVAVLRDGRILAAGDAFSSITHDDFALARYGFDGKLDNTFGSGGKVTTDFGGGDAVTGLAIQIDGKIVAAGNTRSNGTPMDFALARYNSNGTLDSTFGFAGKVTLAITPLDDFASSVAIQRDGRIVVAGSAPTDNGSGFVLARFDPEGALDGSFGSGGIVKTDFASGADLAFAVAIQRDGKIVAAGRVLNANGDDFALARYFSYDPMAKDDSYSTPQNTTLTVAPPGVLANDADSNGFPLTAIADSRPPNGTLTLNSDGSFTYVPSAGFNGFDRFTYHASNGTTNSNVAVAEIAVGACQFGDDFADGVVDPAKWEIVSPAFFEGDGNLIGNATNGKAVAVATGFGGCGSNCAVDTTIETAGGVLSKVWFLGWFTDSRNAVEVLMKQQSNRWILRQRVNKAVAAKTKILSPINSNQVYAIHLDFDGLIFRLFIDGNLVATLKKTPGSSPFGTFGYQVKNTIGRFSMICAR